ncbi:MAG: class I SAM-dependent methyltransferase [Kofleriaceae bacterium]
MASGSPLAPSMRRSRYLSWFSHLGAVYLFHDLYGYLMEMSPDIAELIEAFGDGSETEATLATFAGKFGETPPQQFAEVLAAHAVLIPDDDDDEIAAMWAYVPIKARWNIWQRRHDRITLWTAWGDRPVQQLFLDTEETAMWDAFDGEKRLIELRQHHDPAKLLSLVERLVHSDVQALKLSVLPWSAYEKRPASAPPYLRSTMPYPSWEPGAPVAGAQTSTVSPVDYYRNDVSDAEAQFDHQETTLSHLLRIPHPALSGRTYGQALIDALLARDAICADRVRVLEIGAGLGYVARDVVARLREAGRTVEYMILDLSTALATAQRKLVDATWVIGDVVEAELTPSAFDLIICNEMIGDLPAERLMRADLGLAAEGGTADRDRLAVYSKQAAELGVVVDDAPDPLFLMTGAFSLIAKLARWLAPGGTAVVTEFGELSGWPRLSTHLDHPELSIHFGQLQQAARGAGLEATVEFVIDLLDFDRSQQGLATTRSQFRALRALAEASGVELDKIGYTPELLRAAVADKLELATVGDLRWERIEDRLMGLVPHEFKALIAKRPR